MCHGYNSSAQVKHATLIYLLSHVSCPYNTRSDFAYRVGLFLGKGSSTMNAQKPCGTTFTSATVSHVTRALRTCLQYTSKISFWSFWPNDSRTLFT